MWRCQTGIATQLQALGRCARVACILVERIDSGADPFPDVMQVGFDMLAPRILQ